MTEDIDAVALERMRARGDAFLLLDVRTQEEWELARIEDAVLLPLHALSASFETLAAWREKEVICMCHHGMRSAMAKEFLQRQGFTCVRNLLGGIHSYAVEVDPGIPTYG